MLHDVYDETFCAVSEICCLIFTTCIVLAYSCIMFMKCYCVSIVET